MAKADESLPLDRRLRRETLFARERVYHFGQPTPLERLVLPDGDPGPEIWVKREDLSAVKCYKWRGAGNRMAMLSDEERARGVVTASAGNHAQGVALAASRLGVKARIHMPKSTPRVKQDAVRRIGGEFVRLVFAGDSYDEALESARVDGAASGAVHVAAYDDLLVMAGQGTLADEVVLSGHGPFDAAYLQIGGGGMAAGVSNWLKTYWPGIDLVGVEAAGQASMKAALEAGKPVALDRVDIFCDGTAVGMAGTLPLEICRRTLSRVEVVSNAEVSMAIRVLWEQLRCISEPSGAMGLAAVLRDRAALAGKRVLVVITGANLDFLQLGLIAQNQGATGRHVRTIRVRISEQMGSMLGLLGSCFSGMDIADFQYGKVDARMAWPVFTVEADNAEDLEDLPQRLAAGGYEWEDAADNVDTGFRAIMLRGDLLAAPLFLRLDFYERPGALYDFLNKVIRGRANFMYFNYRQSGERIGRALIGLDFTDAVARAEFLNALPARGDGYRSCTPVDEATHQRLLGR